VDLIGEAEPEDIYIESEVNNKTMGKMTNISKNGVHHKFELHLNSLRKKEKSFVKDIIEYLTKIENAGICDKIVIIAPPKILGYLRKKKLSQIQNKVLVKIDKDLTKLDDPDFEKAIKKIIWF